MQKQKKGGGNRPSDRIDCVMIATLGHRSSAVHKTCTSFPACDKTSLIFKFGEKQDMDFVPEGSDSCAWHHGKKARQFLNSDLIKEIDNIGSK